MFAQPCLHVGLGAVGLQHPEGFERRIGEWVDAEHAQVFPGMIAQAEQPLHHRRGCRDPGHGRDGGQECFVERAAHFEIGFARDHFHPGAEGAVRAAVGDHDGKEHANAEGDAQHVHGGEQRVAPHVARGLPEKNARPVPRHGSDVLPAVAACCKVRWRFAISSSPESLAPPDAR